MRSRELPLASSYAAENSIAAAVKKFKQDFDGSLGESTVWLFKKQYFVELKKAIQNAPEEVPKVTKVVNKPHGRPLFTVRL